MTNRRVNVGAKALSVLLALAMLLSMVPLTVFAAGYVTQGGEGQSQGVKVYMVSPKDVTYDETKSTDAYYYNKIGTPFEPGSNVEFKIAFGNSPGINHLEGANLEGKIGVYNDVNGTSQAASSSDFTTNSVGNSSWPDPTTVVGRDGVTITFTLPDGKLAYGKTYYLILDDFSTSGGQGEASLGKKIVFEFAVEEYSVAVKSVSLNYEKLIFEGTGASEKLIPTISPATALNKDVTFRSTNPDVAAVAKDGTVTSVSAGTATIIATTVDGEKTASCEIGVKETEKNRVLTPVSGLQDLGTNNLGYDIVSPRVLKDLKTEYNVVADMVTVGNVPDISFSFNANGQKTQSAYTVYLYDNSEFVNPIDTKTYNGSLEFTYTSDQSKFVEGKTYYLVVDKDSCSGIQKIGKDIVVEFTVGKMADIPTGSFFFSKESYEIAARTEDTLGLVTSIDYASLI